MTDREQPEPKTRKAVVERRLALDRAYAIAEEYAGNLTVRQLYYQLVARGYIPNSMLSYKRLVSILTDARLCGNFPFEWLLDRTREARPGDFTHHQANVESALRSTADEVRKAPERWLWSDRWYGQSTHVSVWVEKEALAGVFEDPCTELGVAWFVLRGYSSLSALSEWVDNAAAAVDANQEISSCVVLYFGDHDPDGWEIPRSAERNVAAICRVRGIDLPLVEFQRVALVRSQIDEYAPPPFPAKESSARFASYVREHGLRDAWELDALRPEVLDRLIRDSVADHFDETVYLDNLDVIKTRRREMRKRMDNQWLTAALQP